MYNILIFGQKDLLLGLRHTFNSSTCRILEIGVATEFYSIAFSRVFDLWIFDASHPELSELGLKELVSTGDVPPLLIMSADEAGEKCNWPSKSSVLKRKDVAGCYSLFLRLMHNKREQNKERYLAGCINQQPGLEAIVSKSPLMEQLIDLVKDVAPVDSPVFLVGETGTGKELIANVFHNESRRKAGPFMAVNCGALPDTLLESELFG